MVRICIQILRITIEWLEFAFECIRSIRMQIRTARQACEAFESKFEPLDTAFEYKFEAYYGSFKLSNANSYN